MNKKTTLILCAVAVLIVAGTILFKATGQKNSLLNPLSQQVISKKPQLSETLKEYVDSSGFTFSYPDNISLAKNDIADNSTYADIQLSSKDVSGSLSLKITDSEFNSLDDWLKLNGNPKKTKEVKLGNLNALEIQLDDRLLLGALDNGVFFNIEMPLIETEFWTPVYERMLTDFAFAQPETTSSSGNTDSAVDSISFESEEVVE